MGDDYKIKGLQYGRSSTIPPTYCPFCRCSADGDNACPHDGTMAMDMSLDLDINDNDTHVEESSDWSIDVEFVGGGNADVTVVSDDFSLETTEQVCAPPL